MRAIAGTLLLAASASLAAPAAKITAPDALELANGALLVERPASFASGVGAWSAWQLTDGRDVDAWRSPAGAPQGASFVWELDGTWRLDTLVLSTKGADEKAAPGISARTVELFVSSDRTWQSLGRFTIGKRDRRAFTLPPGTRASRVRAIVLENHGNAVFTDLSEVSVHGERLAPPHYAELEGDYLTDVGPLRFTQAGGHIYGCFDAPGGQVDIAGTIDGRVARVTWSSDSDEPVDAMFTLSASGDQLRGVLSRDGAPEGELSGWRIPRSRDGRGMKCTPMPPTIALR